uniref:GDSL esterase/lipase At5g03810-like n=1 Tax=Nicotiana sylvestris TaxID=4096 RepID=A0A1U7WQX9_NICSY|nr:PREDICTED: GDSL esterase/lipase At5g03810-like [Nicotiana sylvestris]
MVRALEYKFKLHLTFDKREQACPRLNYNKHLQITETWDSAIYGQNLYGLGARRIGVTTLPPTGCLPAAITLFGAGTNHCVARLNKDAISFNNKLNRTSQNLKSKLPGIKLVVFDIYQPLFDLITKPVENGFFESRKACCGTGMIETSFLCNARSIGTCSNATNYVFWDGFHPSETANEKLAQSLLEQGFELIS